MSRLYLRMQKFGNVYTRVSTNLRSRRYRRFGAPIATLVVVLCVGLGAIGAHSLYGFSAYQQSKAVNATLQPHAQLTADIRVVRLARSASHDSVKRSAPRPFLLASLWYGLDTTVSPCKDFDRFVNGSWRDSTTLPTGVPSYDVFYATAMRADTFIRKVLDSTRLVASTTPDADVRVVGQYYESCLAADTLSRALAASSMAGAQRNDTARAARCQRLVKKDLQDALGQVFVRALLPEAIELRARKVITNIQHAAEERVRRVTWMDDQAKARVQKTLQGMTLKVARPQVTIDHSALQLTGDVEENQRIIQEYLWKRQAVRSAHDEEAMSQMNQYTANAIYIFAKNTIEVPAFMFQWPFFDASGDEPMGYAGAGMIIGHEMYHGITNSSHATGEEGYTVRFNRMIEHYTSLPQIENISINGALTVGENLADLGGILAAYDAWQKNRSSKDETRVDGFTPEQRFFLHYARVWRAKATRDYLRMQSTSDPHAPSVARINGVVMNVPAFAKAFGCKEGDPMVNSATNRIEIW